MSIDTQTAATLLQDAKLSVHDTLALRALLHPEQVLFRFVDEEGEETGQLSYLQLWQQARAVADRLECCTAEGDRLVLFHQAGLDFIAAFFGCLMSGRIAVPLNLPTKRRIDRCTKILADSGAVAIISTSGLIPGLQQTLEGQGYDDLPWIASDTVTAACDTGLQPTLRTQAAVGNTAFLQYTSGSTSDPKGVMVSHHNIATNLRMMRDSWELDHTSTMVFWQPHHHDMGLILGQLLPVLLGNTTVLMGPNTFVRQPLLWLKAISDYRAVLAGGPNFAYELAAERYSEKRMAGIDLSSWKIALNGADVVREPTLQRFIDAYAPHGYQPSTMLPCYGLAEATLFISGGPVCRVPRVRHVDVQGMEIQGRVIDVDPQTADDSRSLVGCGIASPEVDVAIVDPHTLQRLKDDEVGEIWLHGDTMAAGYWKKPQITEEDFRAEIFGQPGKPYMRTGDIGFVSKEDQQLYICGRLKDLIISDGRNLHPEDIEFTVTEADAMLKPQGCAVFSFDQGDKVELVAALEVSRELKRRLPELERQLVMRIRAAVSVEHGVALRHIVFIPPTAMRKTTSGKIQRRLMKQLYVNGELEIIDTTPLQASA